MTRLTTPNSGNIYAVGYDLESRVLSIQFKAKTGEPGPVYNYSDVPHAHFASLMVAESPGKYFHAHIKNNYAAVKEEQVA